MLLDSFIHHTYTLVCSLLLTQKLEEPSTDKIVNGKTHNGHTLEFDTSLTDSKSGFPGDSEILESPESGSLLAFHAFQEILESVESQESPGFPGKPRDSWLSWLFLTWKKHGKPGIFSRNSGDFLALFCRGIQTTPGLLKLTLNSFLLIFPFCTVLHRR